MQKLLQGMKWSNPSADTRLLITFDVLNSIITMLEIVCNSTYEITLFKTAFYWHFLALLRIGKIAVSKGNSVQTILQVEDVSLHANKLTINIFLKTQNRHCILKVK